ncbi:MAG: transporter substrate-binding domain-containing protein [Verrucomicrobiales bacterium]|nr:transporter substrate-binding domain-containing protein [Verrucomicrobiales bacterium]
MRSSCLVLSLLLPLLFCQCRKSQSGPAPLVVGMELSTPPFEMQDREGNPDGTSVRLAEDLARTLERPLQIEVMPFKGLETALKTGKIDLILSSMTDTPKRRESIDFSDAYCRIGLALLVPAASTAQGLDDLKKPGTKVVARMNTTAVDFVRQQLPDASLQLLDNETACMLEIVQKKADAFVYDQLSVLRFHLAQPEATRALLQPLQSEAWAIALRKGEDGLRTKVNAFLAEYRKQGGFDRLAERYLKNERDALKERGVPFVFE